MPTSHLFDKSAKERSLRNSAVFKEDLIQVMVEYGLTDHYSMFNMVSVEVIGLDTEHECRDAAQREGDRFKISASAAVVRFTPSKPGIFSLQISGKADGWDVTSPSFHNPGEPLELLVRSTDEGVFYSFHPYGDDTPLREDGHDLTEESAPVVETLKFEWPGVSAQRTSVDWGSILLGVTSGNSTAYV